MLSKKNRADTKLVEEIFQKGIFVGGRTLSLKYLLVKGKTIPRVSFVVPKKIEKQAVARNYLRRQGYLILEKYFKKIPDGFFGVFIFNRKRDKDLSASLENEIKTLLQKI
jgi:ribonuclease P protein component